MLECLCNKGDIKVKANGNILEIGADIMTIVNSILNRMSTEQANALQTLTHL